MDNCQHLNIDTRYEDAKKAFCRDCNKKFTVQELLNFFYQKQADYESFINDIENDKDNLTDEVKERNGITDGLENDIVEYENEWDNTVCSVRFTR